MKIKNLLTVMTGLALFCLAGCASPQKEAVAKEYAPIEVAVPERPAGQQDVIQLTAPKLDTVRVVLLVWVCVVPVQLHAGLISPVQKL